MARNPKPVRKRIKRECREAARAATKALQSHYNTIMAEWQAPANKDRPQ